MKRTIFAIAAGLMASAMAAQAGGLLPRLQPALAPSVSALSGAVLRPAGLGAVAGGSVLGAANLPALAAAGDLRGLEASNSDQTWLEYNLQTYPGELQTWATGRSTALSTYANTYTAETIAGPTQDPPGAYEDGPYYCYNPDQGCQANTRLAFYVEQRLSVGDSSLGILGGGPNPPPLPVMPGGAPMWLTYDTQVWPVLMIDWSVETSDRLHQPLRGTLRAAGREIDDDEVGYTLGILGAIGDGALGILGGGSPPFPPLPVLPGASSPAAVPAH